LHGRLDLRTAHPYSHLAARREAELVEDLLDVPLSGPLREKEALSDLAVGQPERD
jgi:hypothetical protein